MTPGNSKIISKITMEIDNEGVDLIDRKLVITIV